MTTYSKPMSLQGKSLNFQRKKMQNADHCIYNYLYSISCLSSSSGKVSVVKPITVTQKNEGILVPKPLFLQDTLKGWQLWCCVNQGNVSIHPSHEIYISLSLQVFKTDREHSG